MKKADISIFESIAQNPGGNLAVFNARSVRNVGTMTSALGMVSSLPAISKIGKLAKNDKFQDVAKKVAGTAKDLVSAGAATTSTLFGYPVAPEEMSASMDAAHAMIPDKYLKAGEKLLKATTKSLDSLSSRLKSDQSMVGPLVLSVLMAKGMLSVEQIDTILSHQTSGIFLPFMFSSAKAGLSFNAASKLFSEIIK